MARGALPRGESPLDPIEKAVRNALEKGQAGDSAFRRRVYDSAGAALDRAMAANAAITPELKAVRRQRLAAVIASIEAEFAPAIEPDLPPAPEPVVHVPSVAHDGEVAHEVLPVDHGRQEPSFAPGGDDGARAAESVIAAAPAGKAAGQRASRKSSANNGIAAQAARLFTFLTLLVVFLVAGWAMYEAGLFGGDQPGERPKPPEQGDVEKGEPAQPVKPAVPGDQGSRDWIIVFSPRDAATVMAPTGADAEIIGTGADQVLRIRSSNGEAGIIFDVGEGILDGLSGKTAVFEIAARAEEGKPTQMSVTCDFAELGECGRKRFQAGNETGTFLFEVVFPAVAAGAAGTITIVSDIDGGGKAVDILGINVAESAAAGQ